MRRVISSLTGADAPARRPRGHNPSEANPPALFAIGDVHGCADELDELLALLPLEPKSTIVFLGDLIDRGPKSRQVIDRVLSLRETHQVIALRGNHEAMLLDYLDGEESDRTARFLLSGGVATLASYGAISDSGELVTRDNIPHSHLEFFRTLPIFHVTDEHFFVHAGVPNVALADVDPVEHAEEMMWTRHTFLESHYRWDKLIIHGHNPRPAVEIAEHRVNLDTGCVFGGMLTAMELPSMRTYAVRPHGTVRPRFQAASNKRAAVRFHGAIPVALRLGRQDVAFVTVDYSEIGLALKAQDPAFAPTLRVGQTVRGWIGPPALFRLPFQGVVIRAWKDENQRLYGVSVELGPSDG